MLRPPFQVQGASSSIRLLPSGTRAGNRGRQSNARMGTRNRHRSRASKTRQLHTHPPRQRAAGKGFLSPHQRAWRPKVGQPVFGNGRVFFFFSTRTKERREMRELVRSHPSPRCRKIPKRTLGYRRRYKEGTTFLLCHVFKSSSRSCRGIFQSGLCVMCAVEMAIQSRSAAGG